MMQQELFGAEALDLPNTRPLPLSNSSNNLPRGTRPPILSFQPYARIPPSPKEILPCPSFLSPPSQFLISETTIPRPWVAASPPYKVLDAPELSSVQKSVISWSKKNQLGVALGRHVYLLPEADSVVSRPAIKVTDQSVLRELTSLSWDLSVSFQLAIPTVSGLIFILPRATTSSSQTSKARSTSSTPRRTPSPEPSPPTPAPSTTSPSPPPTSSPPPASPAPSTSTTSAPPPPPPPPSSSPGTALASAPSSSVPPTPPPSPAGARTRGCRSGTHGPWRKRSSRRGNKGSCRGSRGTRTSEGCCSLREG